MGSGKRIIMKVNSLAPTFHVTDIFDREINLKDYRGKRVLVGFFRHAGCPFCNTRVHRLQSRYEELKEMGLEMIFFFESSKETLLNNDFHRGVSPIPLIADPDKTWYDSYGVEEDFMASAKSHMTSLFGKAVRAKLKKLPVHWMKGDESISTLPAEFLIDEYGMVQKLLYCKRLSQGLGMETIEDFAREFSDNKWRKMEA
jgi:peroxiredoxin Q/BCP